MLCFLLDFVCVLKYIICSHNELCVWSQEIYVVWEEITSYCAMWEWWL